MYRYQAIIFILILLSYTASAQQNDNCQKWDLESGSDLSTYENLPFSMSLIAESLVKNSTVVFCPAGITRTSPNDFKKRYAFSWDVKYNNIYFKSDDGLVFEGMNEHGFSASLIFLKECELPETEKEMIPIGGSMVVNFFIDHFTCVDTALLAVWDIRIFDDLGLDCGWPFRLVLHDTSGATAYLEYIDGRRQLFTPEYPAFIPGGPDYSRLLTLEHITDSVPRNKAESMYLDIIKTGFPPNIDLLVLQYYIKNFDDESYYSLMRYPFTREINMLTPSGEEARFGLRDIQFIPGEEVETRFF